MGNHRKQGFVDVKQYKLFKKNGKPNRYFADVIGDTTQIVSNQQMDAFIAEYGFTRDGVGQACKETGKCYVTKIEWEEKEEATESKGSES